MSTTTIEQDNERLRAIYKAYNETEGEMKEMWRKKWYALVEVIAEKIKHHAKNGSWRGKQH